MTRKSCAVGMRNAILRNYLNFHLGIWKWGETLTLCCALGQTPLFLLGWEKVHLSKEESIQSILWILADSWANQMKFLGVSHSLQENGVPEFAWYMFKSGWMLTSFSCLWTSSASRSLNTKNNSQVQYPVILTAHLLNISRVTRKSPGCFCHAKWDCKH